MDITPAIPLGKKIIASYGSGTFKINDELFNGNVIICSDNVTVWPGDFNDNNLINVLKELFTSRMDIEIVIIGCGDIHSMVPEHIAGMCRSKGIGLETMTTGAACRTYNVLPAEGRKVAGVFIAV